MEKTLDCAQLPIKIVAGGNVNTKTLVKIISQAVINQIKKGVA